MLTQLKPSSPAVCRCVNLAENVARAGALTPVMPRRQSCIPAGWTPYARIGDGGNILVGCGTEVAVCSPGGTLSSVTSLNDDILCALATGGGTALVMTRGGAYSINGDGAVSHSETTVAMPRLRTESAASAFATFPAVLLSQAYSHGDVITDADTRRLAEAARFTYRALDSAATSYGCFWQPVIACVRAVGTDGSTICTSEPRLFTHPSAALFAGSFTLTATTSGPAGSNSLQMSVPAFRLKIEFPERIPAQVAAYEVLLSPVLYHSDIYGTITATTPGRADSHGTLCTVALPVSAMTPARMIAAFSRVASVGATFASSTISPGSTVSVNPPGGDIPKVSSLLTKTAPESIAPASRGAAATLFAAPHSFTAATVSVGPDSVMWGDIELSRFRGWPAESFADTVDPSARPWQTFVKVEFNDGNSVVAASSGNTGAPTLFNPALSYPAADAVKMTIGLLVSGEAARLGEYTLTPDASQTRAVYIHPTGRPFQLPEAPAGYSFAIPNAINPTKSYPSAVVLASPSAPLSPQAHAVLSGGRITGMAPVHAPQGSWDYGRCRHYVCSTEGIHVAVANSRRDSLSLSLLDSRHVASPLALAVTSGGVAAIASGQIVELRGNRVKELYTPLEPPESIAWNPDDRSLWCCPGKGGDSTEVLSFDRSMRRYAVPTAFDAAPLAGFLMRRSDTRAFHIAAGEPQSVAVCWQGAFYLPPGPRHLYRLHLKLAGTFAGLKVTICRHTLAAPAPLADVELTLNGSLRSPVVRTVQLHPSQWYRITIAGAAAPDAAIFDYSIK